MRWVEFSTEGALEFVKNTKFVDNIRGVDIRYTESEGLYDLIKYEHGAYYIAETSFWTEGDARNYIK
jgi:hypothetical protein